MRLARCIFTKFILVGRVPIRRWAMTKTEWREYNGAPFIILYNNGIEDVIKNNVVKVIIFQMFSF